MMFVARPIAQIMNVQIERADFLRAFHYAFVQWRSANFREKRDDIDSHEVALICGHPERRRRIPLKTRCTFRGRIRCQTAVITALLAVITVAALWFWTRST